MLNKEDSELMDGFKYSYIELVKAMAKNHEKVL
jgi:hypothetical protein